jgi:hypothetical protein
MAFPGSGGGVAMDARPAAGAALIRDGDDGQARDARGVGTLDYDNDGDRDIVVFSYDDGLYLFRNDLAGPDTNWLEIVLDIARGNAVRAVYSSTIGAVVVLHGSDTSGLLTQRRQDYKSSIRVETSP